jgi:hypothetical protein
MNTAKRISDVIKNKHPHSRYLRTEYARKIAVKMWNNVERVKEEGTRLPSGNRPLIPRAILNAMCFGAGDGHNVTMIKKYTEAAKAAERFLRRVRRSR